MLSKKAWEKLGESHCFVCGKSFEQHLEETGKRFSMYCRTEFAHLMESWNWKTVCVDCLPVIEDVEKQVLE